MGRFKAIPALPNSDLCGNHTATCNDTSCSSVDPSHSVLESNLESHIKPFYKKGINGGGGDGNDDGDVSLKAKRMAVLSMSRAQFDILIKKIKWAHAFVCAGGDIPDSYIYPQSIRAWTHKAVERKIPFIKDHVLQLATILGNLEKLGALKSPRIDSNVEQLHPSADSSDTPAVVEFGAGRGVPPQMLADCYGISKVFLIDRESYEFEDLHLNAVESLQGLPYLAIGNRLCGPATDMTIRCCVGGGVATSYLKGISIATCCHHLCQWKHYINRDFFLWFGITKDEFHAITWFTSWTDDRLDLDDAKMENEKILAEVDLLSNLSATDRAELGSMCKDLIDKGRFVWLKSQGLKSELVKHVPSSWSPDHRLLNAKPRDY